MVEKSKIEVSDKALKAISRLALTAKNFFEGEGGSHLSQKTGESLDFRDRRVYEPGDDLRLVDWIAYARSEKLLIKRYDEQSLISAYILFDTSKSMGIKSIEMSKIGYAKVLAFCLANIIAGQFDDVSLVLFSNHIETYVPPQKSKKHVGEMATLLSRVKLRYGSDLTSAATFIKKITKKSIFIIISDFYGDLSTVLRAIKSLGSHHETILFQIHDVAERDLALKGGVFLEDLESNKRRRVVITSKVVSEYKKTYNEYYDAIAEACKQSGIDLVPIYTDNNVDMVLANYLKWRQTRKGMY